MPDPHPDREDVKTRSISLALDVAADAATVFRAVSTTAGQRGFWTADCEVEASRAMAPQVRRSITADLHRLRDQLN